MTSYRLSSTPISWRVHSQVTWWTSNTMAKPVKHTGMLGKPSGLILRAQAISVAKATSPFPKQLASNPPIYS